MAEPSKLVKTEQFTQIDLDVPSGDLTAMENLILMVWYMIKNYHLLR